MDPCFDRLGAGTFASVYAMRSPDRGIALKQVADPSRSLELEKEFTDLKHLYKNFKVQGLFHLPEPFQHYKNMVAFKSDKGFKEEFDVSPMQDTGMYAMQRVWPILSKLSVLIQEKFFPPKHKLLCTHNYFIARIYIGRQSSVQSNRFFNPNNFPLDVNQLLELGLPVAQLAHDMGLMLGSINFVAHRDGRDVEFVLGGDAIHPLTEELQYFCIDFNQMRDHNGVAANIVESFLQNDPYYPCPGTPYWKNFVRGYFKAATQGKALSLAKDVIASIEKISHTTQSLSRPNV